VSPACVYNVLLLSDIVLHFLLKSPDLELIEYNEKVHSMQKQYVNKLHAVTADLWIYIT
jgi:hypothetical protein